MWHLCPIVTSSFSHSPQESSSSVHHFVAPSTFHRMVQSKESYFFSKSRHVYHPSRVDLGIISWTQTRMNDGRFLSMSQSVTVISHPPEVKFWCLSISAHLSSKYKYRGFHSGGLVKFPLQAACFCTNENVTYPFKHVQHTTSPVLLPHVPNIMQVDRRRPSFLLPPPCEMHRG